jgi:hypothetical protein
MEQLTEAESMLLQEVWSSIIEPHQHYIADNFYGYLMGSEEARNILREYEMITFKLAFEAWLSELFYCGQESRDYPKEFKDIGKQLPIQVMFSSFLYIRSIFNYLISQEFDEETNCILDKLNKIVNKTLDLNLIIIIKDYAK